MKAKNILEELNFFKQAKKYQVPIWQIPQFIFLVIGVIIIFSNVVTYAIGVKLIEDPLLVSLIVIVITVILIIFTFIATNSFERMAEANRLKTEFVNIVSHQIRAPLSNLKWAIEILMSGRMGEVEASQLEYFKIIRENTSRMSELAKDLLIVSRIEQGRLFFGKEAISLVSLTQEIMSRLKPLVQASNVEVEFEAKENLPEIWSDPSHIKLVVENLLENAIRYTGNKGKVIIRLKKIGNSLHFEVEDNGVGIPKEDQKYIFQKFFRAQNVLRYKTQGTGLGLYISRFIINREGGKIGFKSEENKGSTFWFTLPIKKPRIR